MPIRLISLVILSFFLTSEYIYSDENKFLLPEPKPSIFKKPKKQINTVIPLKKPRETISVYFWRSSEQVIPQRLC